MLTARLKRPAAAVDASGRGSDRRGRARVHGRVAGLPRRPLGQRVGEPPGRLCVARHLDQRAGRRPAARRARPPPGSVTLPPPRLPRFVSVSQHFAPSVPQVFGARDTSLYTSPCVFVCAKVHKALSRSTLFSFNTKSFTFNFLRSARSRLAPRGAGAWLDGRAALAQQPRRARGRRDQAPAACGRTTHTADVHYATLE